MSVMLEQLLEESPALEVARVDETVDAVMARMLEHDYSQLPVVDGPAESPRAIGLISTASIARASLHLNMPAAQLRVDHALETHPNRRRLSDDLWRTLDEIRSGDVLLLEDDQGRLRGILTGQDFTTYLRRVATTGFTSSRLWKLRKSWPPSRHDSKNL